MRITVSAMIFAAGGLLSLAAFAPSASAQTYNFSTSASVWDTSSPNWTGAGTIWTNSSSNTAVFSFAGYANVNVNQAIRVGTISHTGTQPLNFQGSGSIELGGVARLSSVDGYGITLNVPLTGNSGVNVVAGVARFVAAASYTGPTNISSDGDITLSYTNNVLPIATELTVNGQLVLHGALQQIRGLSGSGDIRPFFDASTLVVSGSPSTPNFTGDISRNGDANLAITKVSLEHQILSGSSCDYSNGTSIQQGALIAGSNGAFGLGSVTVASGATWGLQGGINQANSGTIAGTGSDIRWGAIDNFSGNNTLSGTITATGAATIGAAAGSLTLSNAVNSGPYIVTFNDASGAKITVPTVNTAASSVIKTGDGELVLTSSSGFPNGFALSGGRLTLGHAQALSGIAVAISGTNTSLNLNGQAASIRSLSGGDATTKVMNSLLATPAVLTINPSSGTSTFDGVITNQAPLGTVSLTKLGNGTQVLNAAQLYTGATTISAGTLTVSGSLGNTPVTINGGTLDGNGNLGGTVTMSSGVLSGTRTISGLLTVSGGALKPAGAGQGTLTIGNGLTMTGGTIEMQGPGPVIGYDQIVVTGGNVQLGNGIVTLAYSVTGNPPYSPTAKITVINNSGAGTTSGYFAGLPDGIEVTSMAGYGTQPHWFIYYNANLATGATTGGNDVVITPQAPSTIRNGGFELGTGPAGTQPVGSQNLTHWTVTRATVDWASEWLGSDGIRSVDLQGLNGSGGIRQFLSLQPGTRYRLTFGLSGNPEGLPVIKHMRARVNSTEIPFDFDVTGKTRTNMGWTDKSFVFTGASGNTELEFYSTDPAGSWGAVVDNVRLITQPCAADVAGLGSSPGADGQLTVDDVVYFLSRFFADDRNTCDLVSLGGAVGSDGQVTVDDLVAFLSSFFAGCP